MSGRVAGLALLAVLALIAPPGRAEELGVMTARLDGVPHAWRIYALDRPGGRIVTAGFRQSQWLAELQVQGYTEPTFAGADGMAVTVRFSGWYEPGMEPLSVDILHTPDGMGGPFWTSRGTSRPARVEIVRFDVLGSVGEIELAFTGELCRKPSLSAAVDFGTCVEVLGVVETRVSME
ncbi:hypothetical protein [Tropicibacter sp. S64]|uniref:hypothetical protein n=1 Tax=Tropicibacter sp. S64 TaxID=3415122 RepID=UPI003C7C0973